MPKQLSNSFVRFCFLLAIPSLSLLTGCQPETKHPSPATRTISLENLADKVRGGWAGQMIGVTYGAPTEFRHRQEIMEGPREWKPEELKGALDQDDLYVEMTFADVMDRAGLDATTEQYGEAFRDSKYRLWHANLAARRLLKRGVKAPMSGDPSHNLHANDIDFQIESDFIGLMCPGMPRATQGYAGRVGHVMNYGDGVYGGVFVSAMYSAAYFESDPRKVVEAGLAALPAGSRYAQTIRDVLQWSAENPDWKKTWQLTEDKWDKDDPCPDGALKPFNIDASLNGAYIALGLLYGGGDFEKTMEVSMRAGQDSDCNPSSAAGILGVMLGYKGIPVKWTAPLAGIADEKFSYTNYSFNSIVASTIERAKHVVTLEGGTIGESTLGIPVQQPETMPLEQFAPGTVVERIAPDDSRWTWKGAWEKTGERRQVRRAKAASAEAGVSFEGTGAMVVVTLRPDGGLADVYLDGELMATADAYNDDGDRGGEGFWGKFDLPPGPHTLRLVVKGEPYPGSKGAWVYLEDLVVFRK
ncbi:MAG TPA: ADP-ribosylglycohydrolase family protein [Terriglobia bacterium]|nr:ADP-ribosylglycohydrolase family protein [Terriglobia bacterium]